MRLIQTLASMLVVLGMVATVEAQVTQVNVMRNGAAGDTKTDDTAAFQKTLDELAKTGGTAMVPQGRFLIKGHLNIPNNVTLEGIWKAPNAGLSFQGSVLLVVSGAGEEGGAPFITLNKNSCIKGLTIYYPDQNADKLVPYPYTVASSGAENPSIIDCTLLNPYQAVDFGSKASTRHYIRGLYGQPLRRGIYVNNSLDAGRIENVHFGPFWMWEGKPALQKFMRENAEAFLFARTNWQMVSNTYCYGYKVGYRYMRSPEGVSHGSFSGIVTDSCRYSVVVEDCAAQGLLISNGQFMANGAPDSAQVTIKASNTGRVQLSNCAMWGATAFNLRVAGKGAVSLSNCNMIEWATPGKPGPSIEVFGGDVSVNGCQFGGINGPALSLRKGARSAVFAGNSVKGVVGVVNSSNVPLAESGNLTAGAVKP